MFKHRYRFSVAGYLSLALLILSPAVWASGTDVEFRATVSAVTQSGPGTGILTVDLMGNAIPIIVNADTEIEFDGDEDGLSGLSIGDSVEIHGFFSEQGIVAEEVDVLEGPNEQFRLRGTISDRVPAGDGLRITLLGTDVLVGPSTLLERRGPGPSSDASLDDLQVGTPVDARGRFVDGALQSDRVYIGNRDVGRVEFDGRVVSLSGDTLLVDTRGGGNAVVSITDSTEVRGMLGVGVFVEVEGTLDARLVVVAREIKADSDDDGDADDDQSGDDDDDRIEVSAEIPLLPTGSDSLEGKAELKFQEENGPAQQEFEVEIEDALPATVYGIVVLFPSGPADFGTMTTDSFGFAEAEFETSPEVGEIDLAPLLPVGQDVRDIVSVQVTRNGLAVLEDNFP